MTKQEAIKAMLDGKKVRHTRYFSDSEWVTAISPSVYLFEDGVKCDSYIFWAYRNNEGFNNDWEIFNPQ